MKNLGFWLIFIGYLVICMCSASCSHTHFRYQPGAPYGVNDPNSDYYVSPETQELLKSVPVWAFEEKFDGRIVNNKVDSSTHKPGRPLCELYNACQLKPGTFNILSGVPNTASSEQK